MTARKSPARPSGAPGPARVFGRLIALLTLLLGPRGLDAQVPPRADRVSSLRVQILSTMLADSGIGEWGFSALVEANGERLLFDTGAHPDTVLRNARELDLDLSGVERVVLSHNHLDHTGGLASLRAALAATHPQALARAYVGRGIFWPRLDAQGKALVGVKPIREAYEAQGGTFVELDAPRQILPGVWLTGPVPRTYPERNWSGKGRLETPRGVEEDTIPEDQSLVLDTDRGLVVVLGCGHAGVINTLTYARRVVREAPIYAVIGGLHLYEKDDETLDWTATKLRELELMHLLGAHCTGLEAVYRIREKAGLSRRTCLVGAVGASFTLEKGIDPLDLAR